MAIMMNRSFRLAGLFFNYLYQMHMLKLDLYVHVRWEQFYRLNPVSYIATCSHAVYDSGRLSPRQLYLYVYGWGMHSFEDSGIIIMCTYTVHLCSVITCVCVMVMKCKKDQRAWKQSYTCSRDTLHDYNPILTNIATLPCKNVSHFQNKYILLLAPAYTCTYMYMYMNVQLVHLLL